jgi:hypothetical protein
MSENQEEMIEVVEADHPYFKMIRIIWSLEEYDLWKSETGCHYNAVKKMMPKSEFEKLKPLV